MSGDVVLERLLRVIDEGRRTATYKLALLSALIDAVAEHPGAERIPTTVIAEHVAAAYFPRCASTWRTMASLGSSARSA
jgi:hypothetical protein